MDIGAISYLKYSKIKQKRIMGEEERSTFKILSYAKFSFYQKVEESRIKSVIFASRWEWLNLVHMNTQLKFWLPCVLFKQQEAEMEVRNKKL